MTKSLITLLSATLLLSYGVSATPTEYPNLHARQALDNIVSITNTTSYCMIMPRYANTNIGDSEYPGGMKTYCSPQARTSSIQGQFPTDFWSNVEYKAGISSRGARYVQLTGCIRPEKLSRLNPNDGGGQYDSSGGAGGAGNPQGSKCTGYNHYVELVEPVDKRACIKCCDNYDDCPLHLDTSGCPAVIKGNYFNCN